MKIGIELGGKTRTVELERADGRLRCAIDGRAIECDAVEVAQGIFSVLIGGEAFEVRVEPSGGPGTGLRIHLGKREYAATIEDPRSWRRQRGGAVESAGRQQVTAPMPGKVVRVLVNAGDAVEAGQGLVVVEAMKMQNEVRSPKSGTVERLLVAAGQTVNAGEALAIVG